MCQRYVETAEIQKEREMCFNLREGGSANGWIPANLSVPLGNQKYS